MLHKDQDARFEVSGVTSSQCELGSPEVPTITYSLLDQTSPLQLLQSYDSGKRTAVQAFKRRSPSSTVETREVTTGVAKQPPKLTFNDFAGMLVAKVAATTAEQDPTYTPSKSWSLGRLAHLLPVTPIRPANDVRRASASHMVYERPKRGDNFRDVFDRIYETVSTENDKGLYEFVAPRVSLSSSLSELTRITKDSGYHSSHELFIDQAGTPEINPKADPSTQLGEQCDGTSPNVAKISDPERERIETWIARIEDKQTRSLSFRDHQNSNDIREGAETIDSLTQATLKSIDVRVSNMQELEDLDSAERSFDRSCSPPTKFSLHTLTARLSAYGNEPSTDSKMHSREFDNYKLAGRKQSIEPEAGAVPSIYSPSLGMSYSTGESELSSWQKSSDQEDTDIMSLHPLHPLQPLRPFLAVLLLCVYQTCSSEDQSGRLAISASSSGGEEAALLPQSSSNGKRKRSDSASRSDEAPKPCRQRKSLPAGGNEEKLLACPFCKHEPRKYRDCYKHILRNISRLKQHLVRRHRIPIHCPSCSTEFGFEADRDAHIRERSCEIQTPRDWEGITESQKALLNRRITTSQTTEENWYAIYEILFPGSPRPRSPYIDMPLTEELLQLKEVAAREGPAIVIESLRNFPDVLQIDQEELLRFSETMFQDAVGLLLERYASIRPSESSHSQQSAPQAGASQPDKPSDDVHVQPCAGTIGASALNGTIDQASDVTLQSRQLEFANNHDHERKTRPQFSLGALPVPASNGPGDIQWGLSEMQDTLLLTPDSLEQLDQAHFYWGPLFEQAFTNENGV